MLFDIMHGYAGWTVHCQAHKTSLYCAFKSTVISPDQHTI